MNRIILLDVDGVLIVPPKSFSEQYCERYGVDPSVQARFYATQEFRQASLGSFDLKEAIRIHRDLWQWSGSPDELMALWFEGENYPNTELLELVAAFRDRGIGVYLATQQERYRKQWLESVVFKDRLDGIFCSCDLGCDKQEDGFWQGVLGRLGEIYPDMAPQSIAYFDDRQRLVEKAREFGIDANLYVNAQEVGRILTDKFGLAYKS